MTFRTSLPILATAVIISLIRSAYTDRPYQPGYRSRALTSGYGGGGYYSQSLPQPIGYVNSGSGYGGNAYNNPYNPYTAGIAAPASVLRISDTMAYPPYCRCFPPQPVCGNDGISYASICDLVNSMTGMPDLGFRCGTACPCTFNYTDYQALQKRIFRGTFVTCLTNGTTVESPLALQTALIFDMKVGIRNDADCAAGKNGPWRCPNYPTDFPPHIVQSPASRKPMPIPPRALPPGSVVINLGESPATTEATTTTKKPDVVINLGPRAATTRAATTRRTTPKSPVVVINAGGAPAATTRARPATTRAPVVVINAGGEGEATTAVSEGGEAPAEGAATTAEGEAAPTEGGAAAEGAAPAEGGEAPAGEAGAAPVGEGAAAPAEGGAPAAGEGAAAEGGTPAEGETAAAPAEDEGAAASDAVPSRAPAVKRKETIKHTTKRAGTHTVKHASLGTTHATVHPPAAGKTTVKLSVTVAVHKTSRSPAGSTTHSSG